MARIALACVLLAGCAVQSETALNDYGPIQAADFRCPKAGTRVTFSNGSVTRYTGANYKNTILCTGVFGDQNRLEQYYNYWNTSPSVIQDVVPAMAKLFPAVKGNSVQFVYYGSPYGSGTTSQRYNETWRVLGGEEMRIGSRSVHTIVFAREATGTDASNTSLLRYTLWFAPELGVWIRSDVAAIRGYTPNRSFLVTDVVVP